MKKLINRFNCFIGLHTWTWKLESGSFISLHGDPPNNAKCEHCGLVWGDVVKESK